MAIYMWRSVGFELQPTSGFSAIQNKQMQEMNNYCTLGQLWLMLFMKSLTLSKLIIEFTINLKIK